jgi:hypothetical protein
LTRLGDIGAAPAACFAGAAPLPPRRFVFFTVPVECGPALERR